MFFQIGSGRSRVESEVCTRNGFIENVDATSKHLVVLLRLSAPCWIPPAVQDRNRTMRNIRVLIQDEEALYRAPIENLDNCILCMFWGICFEEGFPKWRWHYCVSQGTSQIQ